MTEIGTIVKLTDKRNRDVTQCESAYVNKRNSMIIIRYVIFVKMLPTFRQDRIDYKDVATVEKKRSRKGTVS